MYHEDLEVKRHVRFFLSERHDFLGFLCRQAPHKDSCKLGFSLVYTFFKALCFAVYRKNYFYTGEEIGDFFKG